MFQAAEIGQGDVVIDVGFGSGEQDFLLSKTCEFKCADNSLLNN